MRIKAPHLLNAPARRVTWFTLDVYWFIINLVPKALPLEIAPLQICYGKNWKRSSLVRCVVAPTQTI